MTEFEGVSLVLAVLDVEGEPTIRFVPYRRFGVEQKGMKVCESLEDRAEWALLTAGVSNKVPRTYRARFTYEPL